jgi:hypothetical protein
MNFTAATLGTAFSVAAGMPVATGGPPATQDLGAGQYRVVFEYQAPAGTRSVHLAGSFNGWSTSPTPMEELDGNGRFMIAIQLDKGRYEYKFVLDGEHWETDPQNQVKAGPHDNAVLLVGVPATLDGEQASVRSTPEVNMAARTEHPTEIVVLGKLIQGAGTERATAAAQAWLAEHPMPLVLKGSVSFVCSAAGASAVHVGMAGRGFWTAYQMPRLADGIPVFAVSL